MESVKVKFEASETKPEAPRDKKMKILVLGLGRTGTTGDRVSSIRYSIADSHSLICFPALASGLRQLGYTPYDYVDRFPQRHSHFWFSRAPSQLWDLAMRAKFYGMGKLCTSEDFQSLTEGFDVKDTVFYRS